jgi:hypothetical protein
MKLNMLLIPILAGLLLPITINAADIYGFRYEPESPDQHIAGGLIIVAGLPGDQRYPRAAYSPQSDQYLVVFTANSNRDIYGRFVDASKGETVGAVFSIAWSDSIETEPDVVYDPVNERFLVVWKKEFCKTVGFEEVCNFGIAGRLLYTEYSISSPFASSEIVIAQEHNVIDLYEPSAAFNAGDGQYLVVYRRGTNAVHGQMLSAHTSAPSTLYPINGFSIRMYVDGSKMKNPDAAWGGYSGTFLVVWQNEKTFTEDGTIQARYLYDTYQGAGNQFSGSEFKVAPFADGSNPLSKDCGLPIAAYDPRHHLFIVLFMHREEADVYAPMTIHAQRVKGDYASSSREGFAFPVETDLSEENVNYVSADVNYSGMGDTMYVVYIKAIGTPDPGAPNYSSVYARRINGTYVSPAKLIRGAEENVDKTRTSLAGTDDGRSLAVWIDEVDVGSTDEQVVAVRLAPYWQYLPAVLHKD